VAEATPCPLGAASAADASYGLDPVNDPTDRVTGTYARSYSTSLTSPSLWNAQKKVFLSTEDDVSLAAKAKYVADKGIGRLMIWELAGDYAFDTAKNQYFMGTTLIDTINTGLKPQLSATLSRP
jgi:chitinase